MSVCIPFAVSPVVSPETIYDLSVDIDPGKIIGRYRWPASLRAALLMLYLRCFFISSLFIELHIQGPMYVGALVCTKSSNLM